MSAPVITLEIALGWARNHGWESDVTAERERYRVSPGDVTVHWLGLVERQWECQRPNEQYVFANEAERLILIETFVEAWAVRPPGLPCFHLEIWATQDGYEDRLDELASVTTEALA